MIIKPWQLKIDKNIERIIEFKCRKNGSVTADILDGGYYIGFYERSDNVVEISNIYERLERIKRICFLRGLKIESINGNLNTYVYLTKNYEIEDFMVDMDLSIRI